MRTQQTNAAFTTVVDSPIGKLRIAVTATGALARIEMQEAPMTQKSEPPPAREGEQANAARCAHVTKQLADYFAGRRTSFELELAAEGTQFQQKAWNALQKIPFGKTRSYQEQAQKIGKPTAMRAIGAANGRNPVPIVVPCHRVIGKDGSLTGFSAGVDKKRWLLDHEQRVLAASKNAASSKR
jgi:methylated-DNA-[protein]-cysteine S-methyltransferase